MHRAGDRGTAAESGRVKSKYIKRVTSRVFVTFGVVASSRDLSATTKTYFVSYSFSFTLLKLLLLK